MDYTNFNKPYNNSSLGLQTNGSWTGQGSPTIPTKPPMPTSPTGGVPSTNPQNNWGVTATDPPPGNWTPAAAAAQNAQTNQYGFNPASDTYASDTMAAIARQDFERYQQYFQPLEGVLAGMVNNNSYNTAQVGQATTSFNNQFQASQGQYSRDLSRYGLSMDPSQTKSYQRLLSESSALGQVNAINTTDRAIGDNEMNILFGSNGTPSTQTMQQLPANALGK